MKGSQYIGCPFFVNNFFEILLNSLTTNIFYNRNALGVTVYTGTYNVRPGVNTIRIEDIGSTGVQGVFVRDGILNHSVKVIKMK